MASPPSKVFAKASKLMNIGSRLLLLALALLCSVASAGAVKIEISAPGEQEIPLALTAFLPMGPDRPEIAAELNAVLRADLDLSGLFSLVDRAAFLSDADKLGLNSAQVDFAQWKLLGAEAVIKGGYRIEGGQLIVEARLFDVISRRMLTGRRYIGKPEEARRIAHTFADQVMLSMTGSKGPFSSRIAYVSNRTGKKELYLMEADGHAPIRLTSHRGIVLNPDFSPVGKELIFTSYQQGNPDLYRKEIYTGREARLSHRQGLNIGGRYSPDGREIAVTLSRDKNSELYLLGTDGTIHKRLTDHWGIDVDPSWSPAGDNIAFVSDRRGNPHVYIVDVDSLEVRRLTFDGKYNATPAWSPDGERIAFARMENGVFDIHTIRPDGTDERRLTFGPGNKEHPRWSPDSRFLVYSLDRAGEKAIYLMRADGTGQRRISAPGGDDSHPAWSGYW
jgi:TolB protein